MNNDDLQRIKTIAKFTNWVNQTKYISKIYVLCLIGSMLSPIAWFSFFYVAAIFIRNNPLAKPMLFYPMFIILLETFVQAALIYAQVKMTSLSSSAPTNIGFVYFCTTVIFVLMTFIVGKLHLSRIKRTMKNLNGYINHDQYIKPKLSYTDLFKKSIGSVATKVKEDFK
ncbi:hypothetical protein ALP05_02373 [Pseudomonas caricapapayae]|uniref:Uncharacterized protein n=1 Tax=Pseudomonas caricapapayae TaxID=46678 RepID=A0A3M6ENQ5_9PSED|nr:hypothetical protein [Pseudomonas caricapapayae]RMV69978.1 hypothetical protein ALP05_02373 [Pseudomonas caricapapayae]